MQFIILSTEWLCDCAGGCGPFPWTGSVWLWFRKANLMVNECSNEDKFHAVWGSGTGTDRLWTGPGRSWLYWSILPLQETQSDTKDAGHWQFICLDRDMGSVRTSGHIQVSVLYRLTLESCNIAFQDCKTSYKIPWIRNTRLWTTNGCSRVYERTDISTLEYNSSLLGCNAALLGGWFPVLWQNMQSSSSRVMMSMKNTKVGSVAGIYIDKVSPINGWTEE